MEKKEIEAEDEEIPLTKQKTIKNPRRPIDFKPQKPITRCEYICCFKDYNREYAINNASCTRVFCWRYYRA